ncbi:hypothetical protein [Paenibacillus sp. y28]|uniref:hypothetical protein n=1 Tax=Paenibacillus sp. y28 TaxID=3129110 RepID=UPI003016003E
MIGASGSIGSIKLLDQRLDMKTVFTTDCLPAPWTGGLLNRGCSSYGAAIWRSD